jgi:hypothetical protein
MGGHARDFHDTVSSSEVSECSAMSTSSSGGESEARFIRRMDEATHRTSFKIQGIHYYECLKATSMWFKDLQQWQ